MPKPTNGMKSEAQKGLDWREEFGRGGTRVGAVRARQIVAGENLYVNGPLQNLPSSVYSQYPPYNIRLLKFHG